MRTVLIFCCLFIFSNTFGQQDTSVLTLEEYLGYVKKYHPIIKQARLISSESEIKLLKSRGALDPKLEVDYANKNFKSAEYFNKLNATFKIPTWYGVDLKVNYEKNEGTYLNPEFKTPNDGIYSAGVSMSLAKGLLVNERMTILKQAKLYTRQAEAKQQLVVNDILYNAIAAYFNWLKKHQKKQVYATYVKNAEVRLRNVKKSYLAGDKPEIDTLEASINLKNRLLDFEKASISYVKASLAFSNYLWLENDVPLELNESVKPDTATISKIDVVLNSSILNIEDANIENHPKIQELELKKGILALDKRLKRNNLLPKIDLEYNFLTTKNDNFDASNYKSGLKVSLPLFLRKERADLKLANLKLADIDFDISMTKISLKNKIKGTFLEIDSYKKQLGILIKLVSDYKKLVSSEERKFSLGEGSLLLVNYREIKLIESQLKRIDAESKLFNSKSNLLRVVSSL